MKQHEYRTTWGWIGNVDTPPADPKPPDEEGTWSFLGGAAFGLRLFWFWSRFESHRPEWKPKPDVPKQAYRSDCGHVIDEPCKWCVADKAGRESKP